jgi:precorrin-2/cobalt-factor-2 C20-methyltransferase
MLYGVGVGPGDPELLTLKAQRLISQVPVVFVPISRQGERSVAMDIAQHCLDPNKQEIVFLLFPMSRRPAVLQEAWSEAAAKIAGRLKAGQDGAFLTEGDPGLYSTFAYVLERLRSCLPELRVEIVPGVSSINAAAARSLTPLATGDESIAVVTGAHMDKLKAALRNHNTVVILKVKPAYDRILDMLEQEGLAGQAVLVERATSEGERVVEDIKSLRGQEMDYFSLLIVRKR